MHTPADDFAARQPSSEAEEQAALLDGAARLLADKLKMAERDRDLALEERDRSRARVAELEAEVARLKEAKEVPSETSDSIIGDRSSL